MNPEIMQNLMNNIDTSKLQDIIKNIDPKVLENLIKNIDPSLIANLMKNESMTSSNNPVNNNSKYKIGSKIIIKNLNNNLFNNKIGKVLSINQDNYRYNICIDDSEKIISIKEDNIFNLD